MPISEEKILEVRELLREHKDNTPPDRFIASEYGISLESANRYIRYANAYDTPTKRLPKILLIDIETAPCIAYTWGSGHKLNIPPEWIIEDWYILCYAAKWLLEDGVFGDLVSPRESVEMDDSRICESLWGVLEEADIVIAQNGNKFDIPKINSRLIEHGFGPPSPYVTIDTLLQARRSFAFDSNKLDILCQKFGLGQKDDTDFDLWKACKSGDRQALQYMYKYNRNDVVLLEGLYLYLRPWMKSHPNLSLYCDIEDNMCPHCMSSELDWNIKPYITPAGKYRAFRCKCGAIGRSRFTMLTKKEREHLTLSTAR